MDEHGLAESFYGTARISKRGQTVIPAKARADLGFKEGDKLFVVRHPTMKAVVLMKIDALKEFS